MPNRIPRKLKKRRKKLRKRQERQQEWNAIVESLSKAFYNYARETTDAILDMFAGIERRKRESPP
jgi:hypothetical protein